MNTWECEKLYPFAQSYSKESTQMGVWSLRCPVQLSWSWESQSSSWCVCFCCLHLTSSLVLHVWRAATGSSCHGDVTMYKLWHSCCWTEMDKPQLVALQITRVESSLNHIFSRYSQVRQSASPLLRLTLTDFSVPSCQHGDAVSLSASSLMF